MLNNGFMDRSNVAKNGAWYKVGKVGKFLGKCTNAHASPSLTSSPEKR